MQLRASSDSTQYSSILKYVFLKDKAGLGMMREACRAHLECRQEHDTLWHSQISSDFSHCVWCHLFSQGREVGSLFYYVYVLLNLPWSCFSPFSFLFFLLHTTFICIPEAPYFSQSTVYRVSFFYPPPSCSICLLKWLRLYFHPSKHCRKCNRAINDSHLSMVVAPKLFKTKARASMSLRLSWLFCSACA